MRQSISLTNDDKSREHLGFIWLDQNRNWFQDPLRLLRPDFLKQNLDSWNHKTSPGGKFIGFKMADSDERVWVETSDILFLLIHNPWFNNKKLWIQNNDILIKFVWTKWYILKSL